MEHRISKIMVRENPDQPSLSVNTPKFAECRMEMGIFSDCLKDIIGQAQIYHTDRNIPVLIEGETGIGKEGVARVIHCGQTRDNAPFVVVNCAAPAPGLFESELFGHEAEPFPGNLTRGNKGKVDVAAGGTLFLDDIAEIPLEQQGKLLRLIQEKEFYRVGGVRKVTADVRYICATNDSLEQKVKEGCFRKDLYYHLRVGFIKIPPLRRRKEEILPLAHMFMTRYARIKGKMFSSIDAEAASLLLEYDWPGNIRELRNAIESAVLMYDDVELKTEYIKTLSWLSEDKQGDRASLLPTAKIPDISLPETGFLLEDFIDYVICQALAMHHGNRTKTANYLGVSRRVLSYRLERMKFRKSDVASQEK